MRVAERFEQGSEDTVCFHILWVERPRLQRKRAPRTVPPGRRVPWSTERPLVLLLELTPDGVEAIPSTFHALRRRRDDSESETHSPALERPLPRPQRRTHPGDMRNTPRKLDAATARKLAVEASCDPRTLRRVLEGDAVRGLAGERAREVLVKHGLLSTTEEPKT